MDKITIELDRNEALVLVELLIRFREKEVIEFTHEAEPQILFDLCSMLESKVPELLDSKYRELLELARSKVANLDYETE